MKVSNGSEVRRWVRMCAAAALVATAPLGTLHAADATADAPATASWLRAYSRGEWQVAVVLLEAVPERSRTPSQWLHLARAREKLSHLVEAVDAYERVQELLPAWDPASPAPEIRRKADEEVTLVARRIPWADIAVDAEVPPGAYVLVDDDWLPPARLRSPYPVNPGWHTFLLEVDGDVVAARRVYFEESQQRPVLLSLREGPSALAPSLDPWPSVAIPDAKPALVASSSGAVSERQRDLRAASYFAFGASGLGLLMGAGFAIHGTNLRNDLIELDDQCSFGGCSDTIASRDLRQQIRTSTQIANASLVLGGISAVTGGVLFLVSTKKEPKATERGGSVQPLIGLGSAGVAGRF